jgi:hypothetical protein
MAQLRLISADSHMMEPANFFVDGLSERFKDRAPRVVPRNSGSGYVFVGPDIPPFPVAGGFGTGRSGEELKEHMKRGYEAARPSGWDPAERIKDQDVDGAWKPKYSIQRSGCRCSDYVMPNCSMPALAFIMTGLRTSARMSQSDWLGLRLSRWPTSSGE